jgi:nitrogen-specific signal transduction histidine kinase/CheY-like chemotaxis protein
VETSLGLGEPKTAPDLAEVDRLASIGMLAASIVHDINNPLSYLMANRELLAELLKEIGRAPGVDAVLANRLVEARTLLDEMGIGAEQIRSIARDVLGFVRTDRRETASGVDVHEVIESCLNLTRGEIAAHARVVRRFADVPRVRADAQRLSQVFTNLLVNAAHALKGDPRSGREIMIATSMNDRGYVEVEISDNGAGLAAEVVDHLFEPFVTTKAPGTGTGLGLAICHRIVSGLGGTIRAVSVPGTGATFYVELPALDVSGRDAEQRVSLAPPIARGRILIVDDDPLVARSIARVLASHDVVVETSASAALARLREEGATFDLVLCDVVMPEQDGPTLYARVAVERLDVANRFVFMSAGVPSGALRGVEGVELLAKPLGTAVLNALAARRIASRVLGIGLLDTGALHGRPELSDGGLVFVLEGDCDFESWPDLTRALAQLHDAALRRKCREVTLDLRQLDHMTSSGLKALLTWLDDIEAVPLERRYRVRLLTDRSKHWQSRSLGAIVGLVGDGAVVVDG